MNFNDRDLENLLARHFGRDEFEPGQREIVTSVLSGENVLAVAHRGSDQSVCYKLPALVLDGLTLVVSRTGQIVETEDNTLLPATYINDSLPAQHLQNRIWGMAQGKYKLIYAGPEQFRNRAFLSAVVKNPVSLLAMEDAHRISRWGHDFRSDYLDISKAIVEMDVQPCILALAGACTQRTQDTILHQLQIYDARRFTLDLARDDLSLEVMSALSHEEKLDILESLIRKLRGQGIVYTNSRSKTVEIRDLLKESESKIAVYHAGLERKKRVEIERAFTADQLRVVVAITTGSFGAGLGESNVRYVIHFDMPDRLERYYEQISIAEGDEQPARCILLYSPSDRGFHQSMIERNAVSTAEVWRISEVLERYEEHSGEKFTVPSAGDKERIARVPKTRIPPNMADWLHEYFESLPVEARRELDRLMGEFESLGDEDRNPYPRGKYKRYLKSEHWRKFGKEMLAEHKQCQVCERNPKYVHHLHYRTLEKEQPEDVVVLCAKCHCFIHPDGSMAKEEFEKAQALDRAQLDLFDSQRSQIEPEILISPPIILPYGQMELDTAIDRYKLQNALRGMEMAGVLSVLPDCSVQARARILVPRDELTAYTEDETGRSVAEWLLENSESDPTGEIYIDFALLRAELPHPHDVLEDCLLELHYAEAISYRPLRKGTALRLIDSDATLTGDVFEKLKESRHQALRTMEEYVHTPGCRQRFLCDYLGDEIGDNCGNCDNCAAADSRVEARASVALPRYARVALGLVNTSEGRLSKDALVGILAGVDQRTTRFDKWKEFGNLSMFAPEDILRMLDLLIGHGFLEEESAAHPPVDLTTKGYRALNGELEPGDELSIAALAEDMERIAQVEKPQAHVSSSSELDRVFTAILRCAEETDGQVGRRGLMKVLLGQKSKRLAKYGFDHIEQYGSLPDMPKEAVLKHIDAMIERGCLTVTSFFFPMLLLTEAGRRRLDKMEGANANRLLLPQ